MSVRIPEESVTDQETSDAQSPVLSIRITVFELHVCACKLKLINRSENDIIFIILIIKGS